jgi:hypothetical protein
MLQMPSTLNRGSRFFQIALPISTTVLFLLVTIRSTEELHTESNRDAEQHRSEDSWYLIQQLSLIHEYISQIFIGNETII